LVPRRFSIDNNRNVQSPIGMYGQKLSVEAHIVTAEGTTLQNLNRCVTDVGLESEEYVLNVLASGETVLDRTEREMGVLVADIGGGTTDIGLYTQGSVWHTAVIPSGGERVTNDVAIGLRVPFEVAEGIKLRYGDCRPDEIDPDNVFTVTPFSGESIVVGWQDLAYVIEARVEQLFEMILKSVRESGYEGLLPAGIVLTGGGAQLRGITQVAERVLGVPARVGQPANLIGLVDSLRSPAYATAVGLLQWSVVGMSAYRPKKTPRREWGRRVGKVLSIFLPDSG
jgi:cell division protein FtsA